MSKSQMKYLVLWLFLAGVALIVFIQFISGQNINRSIQGNKRLLEEVAIQYELRKLESDILTVESDIRGLVIMGDTSQMGEVASKIQNIQSTITTLQQQLKDTLLRQEVATLSTLVRNKIQFSYQILNAYQQAGKEAGQAVVNTNRGRAIRDSILMVISHLDNVRQDQLHKITTSIETSGNRARIWGFLLAGIACLACILIFLYIVNKGWQQQRMIEVLNESEKKVKEVASVKEQFLANMSHEIRTPMNAIMGFTNLLKKTSLNSQQIQYVEYIHSSSENLLTLINDILDLSKIEAGMMDIEEAPFSLNGLISSVEIMFSEKARQKGLRFKISVEPSIHDVLSGDAVRLTQVLINLLSNAVKFTDKGYVQLAVLPVKQTAEDVELEFRVQDSGLGIPPDKRQAIFDRFQQVDSQTSRRFGGTGLGLSIVKQLVDLQNGIIQVRSEVNVGTEFIVRLPFKPVYNYEALYAISSEEIESNIRDIKVLIAEDNQMNQQLMKHLMKQWGIDYALVNNGREALEELSQNKYSLVLMDIQMPEMDGYTTTQAIRNELHLDVPIVAMTAHAMVGEKERCLSFGMNDYISKPVKETELFAILKQYARPYEQAGEKKAAEAPQTELIDLAYLKELSMGDPEFENAIIRQFIVQVPDELTLLQEAISFNNFQRVKSLAHSMKSTVAYLGLADKLHPALQRMEAEAVAAKEDHHFQEDFQLVKSICEKAIQEARQLLHISA